MSKELELKEKDLGAEFCLLFNDVTRDAARDVVGWILECNFATDKPPMLNLVINSPGGDLYAAFAIIDIMESSRIPIRTIGLGEISSAGLMIFMAGTKGERVLTPNTSIMSHRWSGMGGYGKSHELIAAQRDTQLVNERMLRHYIKYTGIPEKKIHEKLLPHHDVFLTADEAKKLGVCDVVALI